MRTPLKRNNRRETQYISLESRKCEACWKCIESCKNDVLGKIDIFFHKHSKIINADNCKGCRKCVKACESFAIISRIIKKNIH
jgi:NAD-dependent dihydropyrimidine dehydrogenase PreA subunit